ncbi:ABC transporter G family member 20-like isoform X2 [Photinus pyralis]|uniref:ABC transporter G family member 20-like isoform X2 n=1 Tax=Photinus pyralis TaxID=7054 RepID=UPI0012670891|nr:ABC transporter G family member 20-like isoform X2 [Photinus pyralis]
MHTCKAKTKLGRNMGFGRELRQRRARRIHAAVQELALYQEFTIRETLHYFGGLVGMRAKKIEDRLNFLSNLLMLPSVDKKVADLSGGQQRRVSLASALVHEPELLILDEPTVGVDPVLRQIIWDHLVDITQTKGTTVIMTSHYIDEMRQAHLIGLMRGGRFLAEESPRDLLVKFSTDSLEEVFLRLSANQILMKENESNDMPGKRDSLTQRSQNLVEKSHFLPSIHWDHLRTLLWINGLWMLRNLPVVLFMLLLPLVQMSLFCSAIGHNPKGLTVAIVNYETQNLSNCDTTLACNSSTLSCGYLYYLKGKDLNFVHYKTDHEGVDSVLKGETYASIVIKANYTEGLQARIAKGCNATPWDISASEIEVLRDTTSKDIAMFLMFYIYEAFQEFIQNYLKSCGFRSHAISVPIQWEPPVYGLRYPSFTEFVTPGIILTTTFFLALALTAGAMIIQRNQGCIERAMVSGVTPIELLVTHIICQFVIILVQLTIVLVCSFVIFKLTLNGSVVLVTLLSILSGFCGMCFGFAISCGVDSERMAMYIALGSLVPLLMLSGIVWPVEGMHYILQLCSFLMPLTKATESMRSILQRGWGMTSPVVHMGFISIAIWAFVFLLFSIVLLKFKKG